MTGDRTVLYRGFMVIIHSYPQLGMSAYRNAEYYNKNTPSYKSAPGEDIAILIDELNDHGDFTEIEEGKDFVPIIDTCVGCGQEFPSNVLLYEGIEPIVFEPRCRICLIKQAQDRFGADNVILPESYRN